MTWIYLPILIFAALTLYFLHNDYRKHKIPKKVFLLVSIAETAAIVVFAGLLIKSL